MLDVQRLHVTGGVVHVLTMSRPPVNAMDTALLTALVDAIHDAGQDEETAGLLLAGSSTIFSAGADLREPTDDGHVRRMELFGTFYELLTTFALPTVAAMEGPAIGGGAEAVAACDLRVAVAGTKLRFPGASMGIPVGTARLATQVALGVAKDWLLSGRDVTVEEAANHGLVQRVVEAGHAVEVGVEWLDATSVHDRQTVRRIKELAHDTVGLRARVLVENEAIRGAAADAAYGQPRA